MSGIAFQKRYGDMTVANQTLDAVNKPDIYKMAKMFAPNKQLIAVTETWNIDIGNSKDSTVYFDGRYFGIFKIHLVSSRTGSSNTNYRRSLGRLYDGGSVVCQAASVIHGNDSVAWLGDHADHIGFGTHMSLTTIGSDNTDQGLLIQFIGFKMGDSPIFELKVLNKSSDPIKVDVLGLIQTIPKNGLITWDKPLGSQFSIYPIEGKSIRINGLDYSSENPFLGNFNSDLDFTVFDSPALKTANWSASSVYLPALTVSIDGGTPKPLSLSFTYNNHFEIFLPPNTGLNTSYYNIGLSDGVNTKYVKMDKSFYVDSGSPFFDSLIPLDLTSAEYPTTNLNLKFNSFINDPLNPLSIDGSITIMHHTINKRFSDAGDGISVNDSQALVYVDNGVSVVVMSTTRLFSFNIVINGISYNSIIATDNPYGAYSAGVVFPYQENSVIDSLTILPA